MNKKRNTYTVHVSLFIQSKTLSPDQISQVVGVPCNNSWRRGDRRPRTGKPYEDNMWGLDLDVETESEEATNRALQDCIHEVLQRARPQASRFRALAKDHTVGFHVGVVSEHMPALVFEHNVVEAISELGAGFDIDVILFGED